MARSWRSERPTMPAGYLDSMTLAWPWAESRLVASRNYWIASVLPSGRPYARPVWGVWQDDGLYFSSGSRIRTNLERDPEVSVNLESGDECVIVEGTASSVADEVVAKRIARAYNEKYCWNMKPAPGEFLRIEPRVVFGWLCDGSGRDGGALFSRSATRWVLE